MIQRFNRMKEQAKATDGNLGKGIDISRAVWIRYFRKLLGRLHSKADEQKEHQRRTDEDNEKIEQILTARSTSDT